MSFQALKCSMMSTNCKDAKREKEELKGKSGGSWEGWTKMSDRAIGHAGGNQKTEDLSWPIIKCH